MSDVRAHPGQRDGDPMSISHSLPAGRHVLRHSSPYRHSSPARESSYQPLAYPGENPSDRVDLTAPTPEQTTTDQSIITGAHIMQSAPCSTYIHTLLIACCSQDVLFRNGPPLRCYDGLGALSRLEGFQGRPWRNGVVSHVRSIFRLSTSLFAASLGR